MGDPRRFSNFNDAADFVLTQFPKRLALATPLGLGKPIELLNEIFRRVAEERERSLEIYTALSLLPPVPASDIERRFLGPFLDRHFGKDSPRLTYADAMRTGKLPRNIKVHEFYFQAGQYLHRRAAQGDYLSVNYTHAARAIFDRGIDVVLQLVAQNPENPNEFSLSCNPDVTLDLADLHRNTGRPLAVIGVIHPALPFLGGDAVVDESFFAAIVNDASICNELFALPRTPIDPVDHMIGLYASLLAKDDGTLQIGIGSLSDSVVHSTMLRHRTNDSYKLVTNALFDKHPRPAQLELHNDTFKRGLYGTSELVMDGFMHLRKAGVLKREIFDQDEKKIRYLHGAFFLGSKIFYDWLRNLSPKDRLGFSMTRVSKVNDLYDEHELALRRQRKNARFFNTCMKISILGGVVSDTIETGEVVSGVGGQYNFVAMSHELPDSHSILMLRSTRHSRGKRRSNIVLDQPHETIPRHLRDVVVTEYGIAQLRGRTDEEVIRALIEISDSAFQNQLVRGAQKNGKLSWDYQVPKHARGNTPLRIEAFVANYRPMFPPFPFGSDFTETELVLGKSLTRLRESGLFAKIAALLRGAFVSKKRFEPELTRMNLFPAKNLKEILLRAVILGALAESEIEK